MPTEKGLVLRGEDKTIAGRARRLHLAVEVRGREVDFSLPFEKTLFVDPGTNVPFDLLPAAWHFLERWSAAVPLLRHSVTALDVGTAADRDKTKQVVRDLRVLLHATELVFVQKEGAGSDLMAAWEEEMAGGQGTNERLAFLRAVYQVKPKLCVLPTSWLAEVRQGRRRSSGRRRRSQNAGQPLTQVEVAPGRFVKCHVGDEEKVRAHFERQQTRRGA